MIRSSDHPLSTAHHSLRPVHRLPSTLRSFPVYPFPQRFCMSNIGASVPESIQRRSVPEEEKERGGEGEEVEEELEGEKEQASMLPHPFEATATVMTPTVSFHEPPGKAHRCPLIRYFLRQSHSPTALDRRISSLMAAALVRHIPSDFPCLYDMTCVYIFAAITTHRQLIVHYLQYSNTSRGICYHRRVNPPPLFFSLPNPNLALLREKSRTRLNM